MCNLYANTMPQDAMRRLFNALDRLGNQEPLTAIFPDAEVPIVRIGDDGARELVKARWGWDRTPRGWVANARESGQELGRHPQREPALPGAGDVVCRVSPERNDSRCE